MPPYYEFWEPSRPREVRGGIKAQSKRGAFGESWWAKRWMAVLESFNLGARLTRGRSYARSGQVLSIDIESGKVTAQVQGSRPRPYRVTITVKTLSAAEWQSAAGALSAQALFAAKLLAGEMPPEIEDVFREAGLSLFPRSMRDLATDCSCPDWSNPCKHVAAVYYLLGEEFDRDPFLLFVLRGTTREELVAQLTDAGGEDDAAPVPAAPEPLSADPSGFWLGKPLPEGFPGEVRTPPVSAALPKRLGSFPFWRAETPFLDAMELIYPQASRRGMDVLLDAAD